MAETLFAITCRGRERGIRLQPHRYADGSYVASDSRFSRDYVRVTTLSELVCLWLAGFSIRMSALNSRFHRSPSLITAASIERCGE